MSNPALSRVKNLPKFTILRITSNPSLAKALIGKTIGDEVEVNTPGGGKSYEIIKVLYK